MRRRERNSPTRSSWTTLRVRNKAQNEMDAANAGGLRSRDSVQTWRSKCQLRDSLPR